MCYKDTCPKYTFPQIDVVFSNPRAFQSRSRSSPFTVCRRSVHRRPSRVDSIHNRHSRCASNDRPRVSLTPRLRYGFRSYSLIGAFVWNRDLKGSESSVLKNAGYLLSALKEFVARAMGNSSIAHLLDCSHDSEFENRVSLQPIEVNID